MNGAPDWQDGECCFRCRTQFTLVARKHHCRNCGNIFCAKCSSQQIPLPKLNIEKNVRVCDGCYDKIASEKDNLELALDSKSSDNKEQTKSSKSSGSRSEGSSRSKTGKNSKSQQPASAPSEQDLKEEEELQLALALSLSEAPAKVSFPDIKQFEVPPEKIVIPSSREESRRSSSNSNGDGVVSKITSNLSNTQSSSTTPMAPVIDVIPSYPNTSYVEPAQPQAHQAHQPLGPVHPQQYSNEQPMIDRDQELFRFVAEVQSTADVFTNRINSNKLRNRPIADDSAIQSLFLKLSNMHTRLLEYIKTHDEERAGYEIIQDKLSQISDARAALDALREEHQEKIRQEAAEAERLRQSQLASKLEMMRQKKSQMMQYQREIALQRIQAQEAMLRGQNPSYQAPPITNAPPQDATAIAIPTSSMGVTMTRDNHERQPSDLNLPVFHPTQVMQQAPTTIHPPVSQMPSSQTSYNQTVSFQQGAQSQMYQFAQQQNSHVPMSQPVATVPSLPKVEDEKPLISFDD